MLTLAEARQSLPNLLLDLAPVLPALPELETIALEVLRHGNSARLSVLGNLRPAQRVPLVQGVTKLLVACRQRDYYWAVWHLLQELSANLKAPLPLNEADLLDLLAAAAGHGQVPEVSDLHDGNTRTFVLLTLTQIEHFGQTTPLSPELTKRLCELLHTTKSTADSYYARELTGIRKKTQLLLSQHSPDGLPVVRFNGGDMFGRNLNEFIDSLAPGNALTRPWLELLQLLSTTNSSRPSAKLHKQLSEATAVIGAAEIREQGRAWLALLAHLPLEGFRHVASTYPWESPYLLDANQSAARGLVWLLTPLADAPLLQLLAELAVRCLRKVPGQGPLAISLGNAALLALGQNGLPGVTHLARLRPLMAQENTKSLIDGHIVKASQALGMSAAEIEDMSTPHFGFEAGRATFGFGDYQATLVLKAGKVDAQWQKADKLLKSTPAAVRATHPNELRIFKSIQTQAQHTYATQRDRLDRSFVGQRRIGWPQFTKYYLEHGLLTELVRSLIWRIHRPDGRHQDALWLHNAWRDAHCQALAEPPTAADSVQLWHPVLAPVADVQAWRALLEAEQLRQPLKQAFREVYLLTPPEERTATYSNRMAAHVLRQHQFCALARGRGWQYRLMGAYDKGYESDSATLELPDHGMQAQFWVSEVNVDNGYNPTGMWNYVSTDNVRFMNGHGPVPLPEIPPLVFSEVMRDVDLFVGVASVGNDPQWRDNGGLAQYRNYWESYSFGELGEVAKNRKLALERLVPRLKIGKVSEIKDKFLVVRGKVRTYKIHLGSGNILMEPNDQYLCIVPDRSAKPVGAADIFLPFEGDSVLSIILSKAQLLMNDDQITDETILRQIR